MRTKLTSLLCLCVAALVFGCGGEGEATRTVTVEATQEATDSEASAPATSDDSDSSDDPDTSGESSSSSGKVDRFTNLALLNGRVFFSKYCVKVLGDRIGRTDPPNAKDKELYGNALFTIQYALRKGAFKTLSTGDTVQDLAFDDAKTLRQGDCAPEDARKIETAAVDAG
jgi:hypothetical protein